VSIHVQKFNPAQRPYRRLSFVEAGESGPYWLMVWPSSDVNTMARVGTEESQ
jgi:hypothetical protein